MSSWKALLSMTLLGAAFAAKAASVTTMTAVPAQYDPADKVVTIGVDFEFVARPGYSLAGGSMVFSESNNTLGTLSRLNNCDDWLQLCRVRLALAQGYAFGPHTITAFYTGSDIFGGEQQNPPTSLTFTIYVSDLSSLPAVLGLLD